MPHATIIDALAQTIANLEAANKTAPQRDGFESTPESVVIHAQLEGLYCAFSTYCLEYIAEQADAIARERGYSDLDIRVYRAGAAVRTSGFIRGDYRASSAQAAARIIAGVAVGLRCAEDDIARARLLGFEAHCNSPYAGDPRLPLAERLHGLLAEPDTTPFWPDDECHIPTPDLAVMSSADVREACERLGISTSALSKVVGTNHKTPYRWMSGENAVPGPVALLMNAMLRHRGVRGYFLHRDALENPPIGEDDNDAAEQDRGG